MSLGTTDVLTLTMLRKAPKREAIPDTFKVIGVRRVMEIGVRSGRHLRALLSADCVTEAVAIDIWQADALPSENDLDSPQDLLDRQYYTVIRMADRDSRLTVIREHSTVAVHRFAPASFDYVYIDADHTYEAAARDINLYAPIVRPGGILAGHDYANAGGAIPFGVKRAVDEYVIRNNLRDRVHISPDRPHSWFIVMP